MGRRVVKLASILAAAFNISCIQIIFHLIVSVASVRLLSEVTSFSGHWPASYCRITNAYLSLSEKVVKVHTSNLTILKSCFKTQDIWQFEFLGDEVPASQCDQVYAKGHFFTMYYFHGSNYFHLHYDAIIPMYVTLYFDRREKTKIGDEEVLLPGVEVTRGQGIDWETIAFFNPTMYWMEILKVLSGGKQMLPLDRRLNAMNKTVCIQEAYFGTPRVNFSNTAMLHSFADFVKESLNIETRNRPFSSRKKVGLIHRERRRKILNEEELLKGIERFAEGVLLDFTELSFAEQVWKVQNLDVLVGVNGAGLMNAMYLPRNSVTVQLIPYKAQLNVEEFAELLKARGPYLEWHNKHADLNYPTSNDTFGSSTDTYVHIEEFSDLIRNAITLLQKNEVIPHI